MFQFMTSARIIFGEGVLERSMSIIPQLGYSALLVSGTDASRALPVVNFLKAQNMRYQHVSISGEPYLKVVEEIAQQARKFQPDLVVAMGGGSVIDTGKALSAIVPNKGSLYDYVEVVGRSVPLKTKPLPFIAITTTASSGAEVTRNAVLKSAQDRIKVSLRNPDLIPDVAIVDPALTYGSDPVTSGCGAMDAFTHLMEAYVCSTPNPLVDMICEEGLKRISRSILAACLDDNHKAREDISFAALLGGMAANNANLGAAHGLAAAIGGKLDAPHAVITARLAPFVMKENLVAASLSQRNDIIQRYLKVSELLTGKKNASAHEAIEWVETLLEKLHIPQLAEYGVCLTSFEEVARDSLKSNSIKGNPIPLTQERLVFILNQVCRCQANVPITLPPIHYNDVYYLTETEMDKGRETT